MTRLFVHETRAARRRQRKKKKKTSASHTNRRKHKIRQKLILNFYPEAGYRPGR